MFRKVKLQLANRSARSINPRFGINLKNDSRFAIKLVQIKMANQQTLTLGFSPCPNDTFIFDALVHQKIDTEGLRFEVELLDVEALNKKAKQGAFDITKLSYHAYAYVADKYILLNSGSALGKGCGPLLVAKQHLSNEVISKATIAIPGQMTTANFLFSLAYPEVKQKESVLFSEIENGVLSNKFDAGVIIHENRFTYADKGLVKICDLGEDWETKTGFPIPLGGIAIQRNHTEELKTKVDRLIRKSIEFAFANRNEPLEYIKQHSQEMDTAVMYQHIDLYVNNYSIDLGEDGRAAVTYLMNKGAEIGLFEAIKSPIFLEHI